MTDWTESVLDACDRSGRREGERERRRVERVLMTRGETRVSQPDCRPAWSVCSSIRPRNDCFLAVLQW